MDLEEKLSLGCDGEVDKEVENEEESDNQNLDESTQFEVTENVSVSQKLLVCTLGEVGVLEYGCIPVQVPTIDNRDGSTGREE